MRKPICVFAGGAFALLAGPVTPGIASPFETTSPGAATGYEIKFSSKYKSNRQEKEIFGPAVDFTMPLQPGLETSFTLGRMWARENGVSRSGLSDFEWAMKWEIVPERADGNGFYLTTEPALIMPTATNGFSDKWALEIPVVVGHDFGAFSVRAMAAYAHEFGASENEISGSVLVYRKLSETFGMGLELVTGAPLHRFEEKSSRINIGFKWEMAEGLEFSARIGRSIASPRGEGRETKAAIYLEKAL